MASECSEDPIENGLIHSLAADSLSPDEVYEWHCADGEERV